MTNNDIAGDLGCCKSFYCGPVSMLQCSITIAVYHSLQIHLPTGNREHNGPCILLHVNRCMWRDAGEFEQSHAEEWAQNCASLADFYISSAEFAVAEHLLNCAEAMRQRWGKGPPGEVTQLQADLSNAWAKLYTKRLAVSAKRLSEPVAPAQQLESLPERVRWDPDALQCMEASSLYDMKWKVLASTCWKLIHCTSVKHFEH